MNLAKAKEMLNIHLDTVPYPTDPDIRQAIYLAIEAMTYIELLRQTDSQNVPTLFYGETDD